jgi:hypothetical protein
VQRVFILDCDGLGRLSVSPRLEHLYLYPPDTIKPMTPLPMLAKTRNGRQGDANVKQRAILVEVTI